MSQSDGVKETIDGSEYTVYMLDPKRSVRLLRRIMAAVSPALGALAGLGAGKGALDVEVPPDVFSKMAAELFDRLDEKLLDDLIAALSEVTLLDGKKLNLTFDVHFRGRIGHMLKWLTFALRVQYADFFDEARSAIARVVALGKTGLSSPSTSPTTG